MKKLVMILSLLLVTAVLAACAPAPATSVAGDPPAGDAPIGADPGSPTSTLEPISFAGPEMKVGSTWLYVDGSMLVAVPGGEFTMGYGGPDSPEHLVTLPDFWIYRTKVTNQQYAACVKAGLCSPPRKSDSPGYGDPLKANDPVTGVNYEQSAAYCGFVQGRLPTEAEWEKTARGPDGNIYPWGDGAPSCADLNGQDCIGHTTPVNAYPRGASYYTAMDMKGNAFEWVADWYRLDYYGGSPAESPLGPERGTERSVRGSAFNSGNNQALAALRFHSRPDITRENLGFRCVVEDPLHFAPFCEYAPVYGTDGFGGQPVGEQPQVSCPDVSITLDPRCVEKKWSTRVDFTGPGSAIITVPIPPCVENSPNSYTCNGSAAVSICAECEVTVNSDPSCPEGTSYSEDTNSCVGTAGYPGTCLPGYNYDPASQCCAAQPGNDPAVPPLCPAGTYYDAPHNQCLSVPIINNCAVSGTQGGACGGGNEGGDPTGCQPQSCEYPYYWSQQDCKCIYYVG